MRTNGGDEDAACASAVGFVAGEVRIGEQTDSYVTEIVPHVGVLHPRPRGVHVADEAVEPAVAFLAPSANLACEPTCSSQEIWALHARNVQDFHQDF